MNAAGLGAGRKGYGEGGIKNDFPVSDLYSWLNGKALPRDRRPG